MANEEGWKDDDFLSFGNENDQDEDGQESNEHLSDRINNPRLPSATINNLSDLPPWLDEFTNFRRVSPLVALHNEIVGFCNLMSPMPREMEQRNQLVEKFKALAHKAFGGADKCEVSVFGSQATGLCLPSSDIDIVIQLKEDGKYGESDKNPTSQKVGSKTDDKSETETTNQDKNDEEEWKQMRDKSPLDILADALRDEWHDQLSYMEVIAKTKVPLVKFTHAPTGISIDCSFVGETGVQAATLMKTFLQAMPPLRPLIFCLKYFLAARGLNEPYNGGVGSYLIQLMIVSFLQHRERESVNMGKPCLYNLGCLLFEFFELYGTAFNYCTTGISVRHDGSFFRKGERGEHFVVPSRPFSLAMENPLDIQSDVGKSSFRIQIVQRAFAAAYKVLLPHVAAPVQPTVSILATIIPPTEEMTQRKIAKGRSMTAGATRGSPIEKEESNSPQRKKRRLR